ncbi:hypothetical protein KYC_09325 [Achromobacter arsenitoxydans SY8]|uniref:Uncharacterized protein n=1 Tax=Achromobacter arsenitoxydans SY8 TaxID=477184 RepID=H0F523_9BURK|nr:hypothetical protein KYC_09325 [Achromobacter arsenitoxydans SY8]
MDSDSRLGCSLDEFRLWPAYQFHVMPAITHGLHFFEDSAFLAGKA